MAKRVIRASELGQYKYCARAWWLGSIRGVPSTNTRQLAQGEAVHQQHGRTVWAAGMLRWVALALLLFAVVTFILSFIL
jgi:hypothetical protein